MSAHVDGSAWITELQATLPKHAGILSRLLAALEADERFRAFELQCSVARDAGDELSDLDIGIWIDDAHWDEALAVIPEVLRSVGDPLDMIETTLGPYPYFFVQFEDGGQVDAVARRASEVRGRVPGAVVLLDRDGRFAEAYEPAVIRAEPEKRREWAFFGWVALANADKYLRRGSLWEARAAVEECRAHILRLHAVALGVPYPEYGLTSILDADAELPDGLEATVAGIDRGELLRAALACADVLEGHDPPPLAGWVHERLSSASSSE